MRTNAIEPLRNGVEPWRGYAFVGIVAFVFIVFITRLFTLQVLQKGEWSEQAEVNRTNELSVPTFRGVILDRNGTVLASNVPSYNLVITPALLPDDEGDIEFILQEVAKLTGLPLNKGTIDEPLIPCGDNLGIAQMVEIGDSFAPFQPVQILCDIDRDLALYIKEKTFRWQGVDIQIEAVRDYPTGSITAPIIGFLGPIPPSQEEALRALGFVPQRDKIGYAGVEFSFEDVLRGLPGRRAVEVDVAGQILGDIEVPVAPTPGYNLVLTIDTRLQMAMDSIVKDEIDDWTRYYGEARITSAAAIAMNPQTGEILGMVSYPSYENNRLARFIPQYYYDQLIQDSTQPLLNNAVGAELPAGSVFKIVTSVGALNEGVVTPDQVIDTPPKITITEKYYALDPGNGREFVDWNDEGFGSLNFLGGISNSSNVYFYKLGGGYRDEVPEGLGICRLGTYARALGYAANSGIELPDEADGLIPDPTWKRRNQGENWSTGDTYISSVGQGFMIATPLQILMSAATVANDGKLVMPTVVREVTDGDGKPVTIVRDELGNFYPAEIDLDGNILSVEIPVDLGEVEVVEDENGYAIGVIFEDGTSSDLIVASPFFPHLKWDLTTEPKIETYENPEGIGSCKLVLDENGNPVLGTVDPWVFEMVQDGMRLAVTDGTLRAPFEEFNLPAAGKTGTAEYCDAVALERGLCIPGNWPSHAWTVAYAPFDNPEIAVIVFMYNGNEGSSVAGPVVKRILDAYFELKSIDAVLGNP